MARVLKNREGTVEVWDIKCIHTNITEQNIVILLNTKLFLNIK